MSVIDDAIEEGRRYLAASEPRMVASMLNAYETAWLRIEAELKTLDSQIADAVRRGVDVNDRWLHRQQWWREVQESIDREMAAWGGDAARMVQALQESGAIVAVETASTIARAAGSPFQGRVYAEAMERWVSAIQPGSPLAGVLDGYGTRVSASVRQRMTEGIGSGQNNRTIIRAIARDVGPENVMPRMVTFARTETMRAYRGASGDQFEALRGRGIVSGYVWLSALGPRTCLACIERHGTFYPEYPDGWHPRCRCIARPVTNPAIIPGGGWHGETGPEWFARQPEKMQRRALLTDGRYELYKNGTPLSAMVGVRENAIWGDSVRILPMRDVRGAA